MTSAEALYAVVTHDRFRALERVGPPWDDGLPAAPPTQRITLQEVGGHSVPLRFEGSLEAVLTMASVELKLPRKTDPLATTQPMAPLVTDEQIAQLRYACMDAGDLGQVAICDIATGEPGKGREEARAQCGRRIAQAIKADLACPRCAPHPRHRGACGVVLTGSTARSGPDDVGERCGCRS